MKKNRLLILMYIINVIFFVVSCIIHVPVLFTIALLLWIDILIYSIQNIGKRYALMVYLLAYFLFLMGQEVAVYYLGFEEEYFFPDQVNSHTYILLILGLIGILIGFYLAEKVRFVNKDKGIYGNNTEVLINTGVQNRQFETIILKKIAIIGIIITIIPYYLVGIYKGIFVLQHSYLEYYTSYSSSLPSIVSDLGELFALFFFLYLATFPTKKEARPIILLYIGYGFISLISGRRIALGMALMFVLAYYLMRNASDNNEKWIKRGHVILAIVLVPILIVALYMFKYLRYQESVVGNGKIDMFFRFFYQQGTSINIIKFQKYLEPCSIKYTSLYYTLKFFRRFTKYFSGFQFSWYSARNSNTAFNTNCLADYIYYRINPRGFKKGLGLGDCYLADLYNDGGYILVIVGSILYGILLCKLFNFFKKSVWNKLIALMILEQFFILPRYGADTIFRYFFNWKILVFFIVIYVGIKLYIRRKE